MYKEFSKFFDRLDRIILTSNLSDQIRFSLRILSHPIKRPQHDGCLGYSSNEIIAPSSVSRGLFFVTLSSIISLMTFTYTAYYFAITKIILHDGTAKSFMWSLLQVTIGIFRAYP